ncbi:protein IMPAIRED IN BABA-INDUCED STERILITY 1-like [Zingiber officinale]|uniref:protein IMPAIRED IN BABA-INDUCED STERILITY 1-like n=1 Tax=Zingiber officinale TaxID=94328 RepID=UPI001C4BBA27|nr:protein IMPAIRED IN BABA-INDUCED STERILITY 1-like [Zingiber officinale]
MHRLLSELEHCHSHSIIHGDIECANLLVNNEGILEVSDFGLANTWNPDLWSVGCVLAELFLGKHLLQGRTKVEQLHKIFKLCGSPPDEFWRNSDLPHATVFKPQRFYVNCIKETFECLPDGALRLLETFLSLVPNNCGSASSALSSEYFRTRSYACEPSSLPKYQPNKEIDSKDDAAVGEGVSESLAPCQGLQIIIMFVNFKIEFYVRTCEFEILTDLEGSFHVTRCASEISRDALCHSFCYSFVLLT